jgi:hypothetical protein
LLALDSAPLEAAVLVAGTSAHAARAHKALATRVRAKAELWDTLRAFITSCRH